MHRYGTLDVAAKASEAPTLAGLKAEPWTLKGVRILDCRTEIDARAGDDLIPPSLRPAMPSFGSIAVSHVPDSPVGPFNLAELRVGVRVGAIGSLFLIGTVCDSEAARVALAERWGIRAVLGEVKFQELYHKAHAVVTVAGRTVLDLSLTHRQVLPGTRLNVPSLVNLARLDGAPILTHTPVTLTYAQADGGRQTLRTFDGSAFGAGDNFRPVFPMGASIGVADLTLGAIDLTIDPVRPAEESVTPVAA